MVLMLMIGFVLQMTVFGEVLAAETEIKQIRYGAHKSENMAYADELMKFSEMLNSEQILSMAELNKMDFAVRSVAFYRIGDRQNKLFDRHFYETIEQKMINKFTGLNRFSIHECFECKTTRVLLKEKQFSVLRQLDSNESLKELGEKIGVDHFILWDAYMHKDSPMLNIRVVSAASGQVRWSRQYQGEQQLQELNWEFYTSVWGVEAVRQAKTTANYDSVVTPIIAVGFRRLAESTISKRLFYGYGAEAFFNTEGRAEIDIYGFDVNGRVAIELDPSLGMEDKTYGNWLAYFSVGQAFLLNTPTLVMRSGIEMRINKKSFIDLGTVTIKEKEFEVRANSKYVSKATIGGTNYDLTIGYRFQ